MTNPDLPAAIDLTLHTVNERDLVDAAIAAIRVRVPDWTPQEGDMEVLLAEGFAVLTGQMVFAINQLPRVVLDGLLVLNNQQRHPALPATGDVQITLAATTLSTKALAQGARFRVPLGGGVTADVLTTEAVQINPTDGLTATLHVTAARAGSLPNDVPANTPVMPVDVINWMESAKLLTALTGGVDEETDALFHARAAAALRRRSTTLVVADHFQTAALDVEGVGRAKAVDLWDSVGGAPGDDPGHVTVALAGPTGGTVSAGVKDAVRDLLITGSIAGLTVHVVDPVFTGFGIDVTVQAETGSVPADVEARVTGYLATWLSPATWPWGDRLYANDVIARVGNLPGVHRVTAVTGPAVDLLAPDVLMLPTAPVPVTVTVA